MKVASLHAEALYQAEISEAVKPRLSRDGFCPHSKHLYNPIKNCLFRTGKMKPIPGAFCVKCDAAVNFTRLEIDSKSKRGITLLV